MRTSKEKQHNATDEEQDDEVTEEKSSETESDNDGEAYQPPTDKSGEEGKSIALMKLYLHLTTPT
jgi:hypothetical protein